MNHRLISHSRGEKEAVSILTIRKSAPQVKTGAVDTDLKSHRPAAMDSVDNVNAVAALLKAHREGLAVEPGAEDVHGDVVGGVRRAAGLKAHALSGL